MARKLPEGCTLCEDSFTDPRKLDCGHNFCAKCLVGHIKSTSKDGEFSCPDCGLSHSTPEGTINGFTIRKLFPSSMENDASGPSLGSTAAGQLCCQEKDHEDMQAQVHCKTHRKLICGRCTTTSKLHKDCRVEDIQDALKDIKTRLDFHRQRALKQLSLIEVAESAFEQAERELLELKNRTLKELGTLKDNAEQVVKAVDEVHKNDVLGQLSSGNTLDGRLLSEFDPKWKKLDWNFDILKESVNVGIYLATRCGTNVAVEGYQVSAFRNDHDNRGNATVLTEACLLPDEKFCVRLDDVVGKSATWTSVGIGVTTNNAYDVDNFPYGLTDFPPETWTYWEGRVEHNGQIIKDDYMKVEFKEGDKVGVMVTSSGELHFFHNYQDQGVAATGLPSKLYGVISVWGRTVQVSVA